MRLVVPRPSARRAPAQSNHQSAGHGSHLHRGRPEADKPLPWDATTPRLRDDDRWERVGFVVEVAACLAYEGNEGSANVEVDPCEPSISSLAEARGGTP